MGGSDGNQAGRSMSFSFSDFTSALQAGASLEYLAMDDSDPWPSHPCRSEPGRLIGWEHRPANARAMGILKRLDRQIERLPPGTDIACYERYLASLPPERDNPDADSRIGRRDSHVPPRRRA
jgi:hypothetical protein